MAFSRYRYKYAADATHKFSLLALWILFPFQFFLVASPSLQTSTHVFYLKKNICITVPLSLYELSTGSEKDSLQGRLKFTEKVITAAVTSKILSKPTTKDSAIF